MESASSKVAVVYQSERKLRQATLSFGKCVKLETKSVSPTSKNHKIDDRSGGANNKETEAVNKGKQEDDGSFKSCEDELMEVEVIEDETVVGTRSNVNEVSDIVKSNSEMKDTSEENEEDSDVKTVEVINSDTKEDSGNNKRKSECNDKEQKPCKRVKLINHMGTIKPDSGVEVNSQIPVTTNCVYDENAGEKCEMDIKEDDTKFSSSSNSEDDLVVVKSDLNNKVTDTISECNSDFLQNEKEVLISEDSCNKNCEECVTPEAKKNSLMGRSSSKKLTPKQLERMAKKKEEKELLQQEKERKKKEKEEEKVRLKQEKEEVKKKLREEKEKKKLAEIELKNEEKKKKEEEKRKKEEQKLEDKRRKEEQKLEDKRRKEEQKLEDKRKKEEMQRKKEEEEELIKSRKSKEAEAFYGFFRKSDVARAPVVREDEKSCNEVVFMPFTVKADMRLAPVNRNPMDDERRETFEKLYSGQSEVNTYLIELRSGCAIPRKSGNTWPLEEKYDGDDIVVLDEGLDLTNDVKTVPRKMFNNRRPKLLQFSENRRPPYWGTWRKKSKLIRPKNPFGKDEIFDYEVDSDDEWEEEEPGESLHGSDDEKESEDEYEVDNDFFVPHGYLSDDENPEEEIISPETQKAKLKLLGEQFDQERNEKTKLLKPITLGCIWFNNETDESASANPSVVKFLNKRKAVLWTDTIPIPLLQDENTDPNDGAVSDQPTPTSTVKKATFPDSAIPDLITLMHGSTSSRKKLATTFLLQWNKKEEEEGTEDNGDGGSAAPLLSQARIAKKIKELGKWEEFPEEGPCCGKWCWYVKKEIREKYGVENLVVANKVVEDSVIAGEVDGGKKASPPLITKFTKVLTEDERMMALKANTRKPHVSTPRPLSESTTPNTTTVPRLKCSRKLAEFWANTSITSKYNIGRSTLSEATIAEADEDVEVTGKIKGPTLESGKAESGDKPVAKKRVALLCSGPRGCEIVRPDSATDEVASEVKDDSDAKPTPKKRVAILCSAPRGCDVVRPSHEAVPIEMSKKHDRDIEISNEKKPDTSGSGGDAPRTDDMKSTAKKRVAILSSAPLGCEVVRPAAGVTPVEVAQDQDVEMVNEIKSDNISDQSEVSVIVSESADESVPTESDRKMEITAENKVSGSCGDMSSGTGDSKPNVRKRVALLSSAPLGVEVVRPASSRRVTLDKVIAKYEKFREPNENGED